MFPFVVDYRYMVEPSLSIYQSTKSAFRANTRGTSSRQNTKPSRLSHRGVTTSSPTLASEFPGLHYNRKLSLLNKPTPIPSSHRPQRKMSSYSASSPSDLSMISEDSESDMEESSSDYEKSSTSVSTSPASRKLSRTSTTASRIRKCLYFNFLRRKTSDSS